MLNFTFHNPTKIVFGRNTIDKIGREISEDGHKKVLLIYGMGSIKRTGVYDLVVNSLKSNGVEFVEVSGVKPNPVLSKAMEAVSVAKKEKVTAVLGVGGGSVVDTAKTVAAGTLYEGNIWDAFTGKYQPKEALPVYVVLTLSATGTEMNPNAVITNEETGEKYGMSHPCLYPKVSVIDPSVQFHLPPKQTANGAVDAMAHIFEYYFSGVENTDVQDEMAEGVLRTLIRCTERLLDDPTDYEARAQFAWCTTLALNGFLSAGVGGGDWACHAIEHSLSALYDIAHGEGLAIVIPAWMKYTMMRNLRKYQRFAERVMNISPDGKSSVQIAAEGIEKLKTWFASIGQPTTLKEAGIPREDIPKIMENVAKRTLPLGKLVKLDKEDIIRILEIGAS